MLCADWVMNGAGLTSCTWGCLGSLAGESAHLINSGEGMKIHFLDFVTRKRGLSNRWTLRGAFFFSFGGGGGSCLIQFNRYLFSI